MPEGSTGQGRNSLNAGLFNECSILSALRRLGSASKADLARHANLTGNTGGVIVRDLEAQRLIQTEGKRLRPARPAGHAAAGSFRHSPDAGVDRLAHPPLPRRGRAGRLPVRSRYRDRGPEVQTNNFEADPKASW